MRLARIIISLLAAGVFIWGVFNVTKVKDMVDEDLAVGVVSEQVQVVPSLHFDV